MAFRPLCATCRSFHWPHDAHAAEAPASIPVLVVVHPGSACGSADSNLGRADARAARDALVWELQRWNGAVLVIDGELSDELDATPFYAAAIETCLARNGAAGHLAQRVVGDDPDQVLRIGEFIGQQRDRVASMHFTVTGAWYELPAGEGCVGSVIQEIRRRGFSAEVAESAVVLDLTEPEVDVDGGRAAGQRPR